MRTSFKFVASSCYILILPLCAEFLNGVQGSVDIQQAITGQASGSDFPWQEVSSHGPGQTTEGGGLAAAYLVGAWGACIQGAGQGGKELGEGRCVRQREVRCTAGGVYASESTCGALTTPAAEQACACSEATSLREFLRGGAAAAAAAGEEEEEEEEGTGGAAAAGAAAGGGGGDWRREPAAAPFAAVRVNPLLAGGGHGEADQNKDSAPDIAQPDRIQASPSGVPERIKLGDPSVGENGPEQVERLPGDIGAGTGTGPLSTSLALFGAGVAALLAAYAAHRIRDVLLGRGAAGGDKDLPAAAYGYYNALSAADGRDPAAAAPRTAARDEAAAAAAIRNPALMSPEEFRALEDQLALEEEAAARRAMFGEGGPGHAALLGGVPPPPL